MEKIRVFIKIKDGKIVCVCKTSNKGCGCFCQKDVMYYDKFRGMEECFKNKGDKNYRGAR